MLRVPNVPLLCRSMNPASNVGFAYPSSRGNFARDDDLEGIIDNGAHQYTTASGLVESAQIESHQDWVLQKIEQLTAVKTRIDAELRELQELYHKQQDALAQQRAHMPFTATTTPYVPFTATSPYSTTNVSSHPFSQTANLSTSQDETWNIPPQPTTYTSQQSIAPYAQTATNPPPKYTVHNRAGKRVFRCECGRETSRKGDMIRHHLTKGHVEKSYICHCGKGYTRNDSLLRHAITHTSESPVF